jgi:hypothetical protein
MSTKEQRQRIDFECHPHLAAQPSNELQKGRGLGFQDGFHHPLPSEFTTATEIVSVCTSIATYCVLSMGGYSFL